MKIQRLIGRWAFPVLMLALSCSPASALDNDQQLIAHESPLVQPLLERALSLEKNTFTLDSQWQAAIAYCQASRLGSAEGQYRLGMLYAFGKGVPEDRALAASMFSLASARGHYAAQ